MKHIYFRVFLLSLLFSLLFVLYASAQSPVVHLKNNFEVEINKLKDNYLLIFDKKPETDYKFTLVQGSTEDGDASERKEFSITDLKAEFFENEFKKNFKELSKYITFTSDVKTKKDGLEKKLNDESRTSEEEKENIKLEIKDLDNIVASLNENLILKAKDLFRVINISVVIEDKNPIAGVLNVKGTVQRFITSKSYYIPSTEELEKYMNYLIRFLQEKRQKPIKEQETELENTKNTIIKNKNEISKMQIELKKLQIELSAIEIGLERIIENIKKLITQISVEETEMIRIDKLIVEKSKEAKNLKGNNLDINIKRVRELSNEKNAVNIRIIALKKDLETAKNSAEGKNNDLSSVKTKIIDKNQEIVSKEVDLEAENNDLVKQEKELKNTIEQVKKREKNLKLEEAINEVEVSRSPKNDDLYECVCKALNFFKHKEIIEYVDDSNRALKIKAVRLQIEDGYIEEMTVYAEENEKEIIFKNLLPIPFSSNINTQRLGKYWLHEKLDANAYSKDKRHILVGDVLQFDNLLVNRRRDYAPADTVVLVKGGENRKLYKEAANKILQAKIFTDFVGFNQENPNGLAQTEVSKRLNIYTQRWTSFLSRKYTNFGLFEYLEPILVVSKIEQNNRRLPISSNNSIINNQLFSSKYASTLDLLQYEHLSLGANLNVFLFDIPNLKSTFYVNIGGRVARTAIIDSLYSLANGIPQKNGRSEEYHVNTWRIVPEIIWKVEAHEVLDISAGFKLLYFNLADERFRQIANLNDFTTTEKSKNENWLANFEIIGRYSPNSNGDWFLRYRLISQWGNWNNNFSQVQFGKTFYFTKKN
jgi:hypothetical protein